MQHNKWLPRCIISGYSGVLSNINNFNNHYPPSAFAAITILDQIHPHQPLSNHHSPFPKMTIPRIDYGTMPTPPGMMGTTCINQSVESNSSCHWASEVAAGILRGRLATLRFCDPGAGTPYQDGGSPQKLTTFLCIWLHLVASRERPKYGHGQGRSRADGGHMNQIGSSAK